MRKTIHNEILNSLEKDSIFEVRLLDKNFSGYCTSNLVFTNPEDIVEITKTAFISLVIRQAEFMLYKKLNPVNYVTNVGLYYKGEENKDFNYLDFKFLKKLNQYSHIFIPRNRVQQYRDMLHKFYVMNYALMENIDKLKIVVIDTEDSNIYLVDNKKAKINYNLSVDKSQKTIKFNWSMIISDPNVIELFIN